MGLIIPVFKQGGHEFENAYANVEATSKSGKTTFQINVYKSKTDLNLISTIPNRWFYTAEGSNDSTQAYVRIAELCVAAKAVVAKLEADVATETNEEKKMQLEAVIENAKKEIMLQFDGAYRDPEE